MAANLVGLFLHGSLAVGGFRLACLQFGCAAHFAGARYRSGRLALAQYRRDRAPAKFTRATLEAFAEHMELAIETSVAAADAR